MRGTSRERRIAVAYALRAVIGAALAAMLVGIPGEAAERGAAGGVRAQARRIVVFDDSLFADNRNPSIQAESQPTTIDAAKVARRLSPGVTNRELAIVADRAGLHSISPAMAIAIEDVAGVLGSANARAADELERPLTDAVAAFYRAQAPSAVPDAGLRAVAGVLTPLAPPDDALAALRREYARVLELNRSGVDAAVDVVAPDAAAARRPQDGAGAAGLLPPLGFLAMPFQVGSAWAPGGVHTTTGSNDGSPMSSIDWSDDWPVWNTDTSTKYVTAMHGGTVTVYSSCNVRVTNANGWATNYYHLDGVVVTTGQVVTTGTVIGVYAGTLAQALCQGGSSTGPHTHVSLIQNGLQYAVDGANINGWTVHAGRFSYDTDHSFMWYIRNAVQSFAFTDIARDDCRVSSAGIAAAPASGGSVSLPITTGTGCPWEVTSPTAWITVAATGAGTGSTPLILSANSGAARTATVDVAGTPVSVTQAGAFVAPTGVSATASAAQTVSVGWTPPVSTGGRTISGYRIVLTPTSGTPLVINTGVTTAAAFSGVPSGAYGVTVTARASNGDLSIVSSPAAGVTVLGVPLAPTGVALTPTGGGGNATVSWTAPANNGGSAITWYRIVLSPTDSSGDVVGWAAGGSSSQTLYGLRGKTYTARVAAYSAQGLGVESAPSAASAVSGVPGTPPSVSLLASGAASWTTPTDTGGQAILGYRVMLVPSSGAAPITKYLGPSVTSTTFTQGQGVFSLQVAAYNAAGLGATTSSNGVSLALAAPPAPAESGAPFNVAASASGSTVSMSWSVPASSGGSAISLYRITARNGLGSVVTSWLSAASSGAVYYLPPGSWLVSVAGYNSSGLGAEGFAPSLVTTTGVPGSPPSVSAVPAAGLGYVDVSWTAPPVTGGTAIAGYRVLLLPSGGGPPVVRYANVGTTTLQIITASPGSYTAVVEAFNANGLGIGAAGAPFTITNNFGPPLVGEGAVDAAPPAAERPVLAPDNTGPPLTPTNDGAG